LIYSFYIPSIFTFLGVAGVVSEMKVSLAAEGAGIFRRYGVMSGSGDEDPLRRCYYANLGDICIKTCFFNCA